MKLMTVFQLIFFIFFSGLKGLITQAKEMPKQPVHGDENVWTCQDRMMSPLFTIGMLLSHPFAGLSNRGLTYEYYLARFSSFSSLLSLEAHLTGISVRACPLISGV